MPMIAAIQYMNTLCIFDVEVSLLCVCVCVCVCVNARGCKEHKTTTPHDLPNMHHAFI
jgi:hypothetical protein